MKWNSSFGKKYSFGRSEKKIEKSFDTQTSFV